MVITPEENKIIIDQLPEGFDWEDVNYTVMGNFGQLLYRDVLVGYIMFMENRDPFFKASGLWKG